jgi:dTDP-glucose 4,6-dehydratase
LKICRYLISIAKQKIKIGSNVKIQFVKDRPGHDVRYALDSKKILKKLSWKAKINFKNGLEKTFLWYLQNDNYYKSISKNDIVKRIGKI